MGEAADRVAAESWFLQRGLPSVLTRRARWRRLWPRSAPALAAYATVLACLALVDVTDGGQVVDVDDNPTPAEVLILVVLAAMLPLAVLVSWLVSRVDGSRGRRGAATASVVVAVGCALVNHSWADRFADVVTIAQITVLILVLNGLGVGSVLGWAVRLTVSHLASAGALVTRALPVVLLTVLVFFNGFVWSMANKIGRDRMWLVVGFMVVIAIAFLCSGVVERTRPVLGDGSTRESDTPRLAKTPFASMPDPVRGDRLRPTERANVVFVVIASQITQIAMVAIVTAAIFFVMGLLVLSPAVLAAWTTNGSDQGTWFGMTLPVPQPLIHVTMFLGALTFMYVSARSVGDGEYRKQFLDPLVDDLRLNLVARNRYRAYVREGR
ncbi:hypothetical protein ASD37_16525 [Mycobacterium sp. Root135]|nr:hypothetical protein ASD37_16525 [Mycobacterium sp. Root135]